MSAKPHLLIAISGHGYGHLAQVLPVIDTLRARLPQLRLTLRTSLPEELLRERIAAPFRLMPSAVDFGMRMHSALEVDTDASARDYQQSHQHWPQRVQQEADVLSASGADLILANIPYLTLAAAAQAGIPAVAMCSLNWAVIYRHYCGQRPEAAAILEQMQQGYSSALTFLCPQPSMTMPGLHNTESIGPLTRPNNSSEQDRAELRRRLHIDRQTRILLVGMGGVGVSLPVENWPRFPGWRLIVANTRPGQHPDVTSPEQLGLSFAQLLGCTDALLTKPGYGTYVEAASLGLPVLYVSRTNWPEEPFINPWLQRHTRATEINRDTLDSGGFLDQLNALLQRPAPPRVSANGASQAADRLLQLLPQTSATTIADTETES